MEPHAPAGPPACTPAQLFELMWSTMADVLGTPATATLIRRCTQRAAARSGDLADLAITRSGFDYAYTLPAHWQAEAPEALAAVKLLAQELTPLLTELTGPVVVRRLNAVAELRRCGVPFEERQ